jgi:hypothetical protein
MINIGIVGLGFMAATHVRAYRQVEGARVLALCNPSGRHLDGDFTNVTGNVGAVDPVKLDMSGVKATRDFADLLDDSAIHVIDICAPTKAHADLAIARCARASMCSVKTARAHEQSRSRNRQYGRQRTGLLHAPMPRFWPEWARLKQRIENNSYGKVLAARFGAWPSHLAGARTRSSTELNPAVRSSTCTSTIPTLCSFVSAGRKRFFHRTLVHGRHRPRGHAV